MIKIHSSIFKTNDIRGKFPLEINCVVIEEIIKVLTQNIFQKGAIIVAHDARNSSKELYQAAIQSLSGRKIIKIGKATTPMFYYFVITKKASGGIMITASHNPSEWNGLKMVKKKALPIRGTDVKKVMEKHEYIFY